MTQPDFQLRVENATSHLALAELPAKEVAALISTITDIIEAASGEASGEDTPGVTLTGVSEKSVWLGQRLSERCHVGAAAVIAAILAGDFSSLPVAAHEKLVAFSRQLIGRGRVAFLAGVGGEAEISASKPVPEVRPRLVRHLTTLYGEVVSAGGILKHRATLILSHTGKSFDIDVNGQELVKQLAGRMYDTVGVTGAAWTDMRSGLMKSFTAESLTRYRGKAANPLAALDKIAADSPEAWAGVDVPAYISDLRDGEGS